MSEQRERSPVQEAERNGGGDRDRPRRDARDRRPRGPTERRGGKTPLRRVYVSNIPFDYPWQELKDLFRNEVGAVKFVELFTDERGNSRGCGIIEFDSDELVDAAIDKMHRYDLKGRKMVVKEDLCVERDRHGYIVRGGGGGGDWRERGPARDRPSIMGNFGADRRPSRGGPEPNIPPPDKYGNTYGLNIGFLESLKIEGPLVNRAFVANFDYKVTEENLREVFSLAGKVNSVEINRDSEGKSKGHGIVTFDHPVEAVQAISMLNGQTYMDRRISVRMDRVKEERDKDAKVSLPVGLQGIGQGLGANGVPLADVATKVQETRAPAPVPAPVPPPASLGGLGQLVGAGLMGAAPGSSGFDLAAAQLGAATQLGAAGGQLSQLGAAAGQLGAAAGQLGQLGAGTQLGGGLAGAGLRLGSDDLGRGLESSLAGRGVFDMGAARSLLDSGRGGGGGGGVTTSRISYPIASSGGGGGGIGSSADGGGFSAGRSFSDSIIINNLDPSYTWQTLRDQCRRIGDVRFADIKGKGVGIVRFTTAQDAQRAISMLDGQRLDGKVLDVRSY